MRTDFGSSFKKVTTLYVDRHTGYRDKLAAFLRTQGGNLLTADNAYEGMKRFRDASVDIVLIDVDMPEDEHLKFCRYVKKHSPKIPVVVLSAREEASLIVEMMHIGVKNYLFKPIDYDVMLEALQELATDVVMNKEHRKNMHLLEQYKDIVDRSNVLTKTNPDGIITYVNQEFIELSGYSEAELLGQSHRLLRHPDNPESLYRELWETISSKKVWRGTMRNRSKEGKNYTVDAMILPILNDDDEIVEYIAIRHDITPYVEHQQTLKRRTVEKLRRFPDREDLFEALRHSVFASLAVINIDNFRGINDLYGFDVGDRVLQEMGTYIESFLEGSGCKLYRLPADEYAVMVDKIGDIYAFKTMIESLLTQIGRHLFDIGGNEVYITATAGVAHQHESVFSHACMALGDARTMKKTCLVYDESDRALEGVRENVYLNSEVKRTIENGFIVPYYQPIMNAATGKIETYEALARIVDENGQVLTPYYFMEMAKKDAFYGTISMMVIEQSFQYFAYKPFGFSVNLSIEDILDSETAGFILEQVRAFPQPHRIVFEVTEPEGTEHFDELRHFLRELKTYGCNVAIDNFGAGRSSFDDILKLDVDYLKIDGSLMRELLENGDVRASVEMILDFARKLGIKTVAEFVADEALYAVAETLGADYMQGNYIGEPVQEIEPSRAFDRSMV